MNIKIYSYDRGNNKILCNLKDVCDFTPIDIVGLLNQQSSKIKKLEEEIKEYEKYIRWTGFE